MYPLGLLNADRSNLSSIEWTLFSNVVHSYDRISPVKSIHQMIACQSKLPLKIRSKLAQDFVPNLIISFYTSLQSYMKCTKEFQALTDVEQICIYQRNFHSTSNLIGQLILHESGLFDNPTYLYAFASLYDTEVLQQAHAIVKRLDCNSTLVKVFLVVISFSSNCFMLNFEFHNYGFFCTRKFRYEV